jgi:adenosine kinase
VQTLISGSIAFDYLMSFPGRFQESLVAEKLDRISVSFLVDTLHLRRGGCAPNVAHTLALLGERPLLVGAAGHDFNDYGQDLARTGVDLAGVLRREDVVTASFFANTDQEGNQICSFFTGAMQYAREISLTPLLRGKEDLVLVSPNDPEAMGRHAREAKEAGCRLIYDPSQQIARLDGETLLRDARGAWLLICNEYEEEMFLQKSGLARADLAGVAEIVIVTLGERGAVIRTPGGEVRVPAAAPDRILDPTGVGDAFRGGLMKGILDGLPWETAGRMGSLAAAYVLETDGPQNHRYTPAEFLARYVETFGAEGAPEGLAAS